MQVSIKWLHDYIDFTETAEELADKLTMAGIPVENVIRADEGLEIDKTNILLWKNKFCALIELDRLIEAKEVQDLIFDLEIANDKAEGSLKKAINRFYSMEYRECLNLCYDVLDADKDNEEAAILMMNAVYLLGDLNEAPKALYRALNCNGGEILTRN